MRPVSGGRDGPGRRSCGCGRSRVAARPRPADPSQPPTRCPSATTPRLLDILHPVSGGGSRGRCGAGRWRFGIGKHWRAGAGHGGVGMARSQGRMAGAGWRALSGVATGREERGRHQHPAPCIPPPTARVPNSNGRGSEHIYCPCVHRRTGRRAHGASAPSGGGDWPGAVGGASSGARRGSGRGGTGWHWVALCGTGWHWMALDGIGWHWMALVAFWWGEIGPSLQFTLSWCARPFPRTTPCRARALLFLSLPLPLPSPLLPSSLSLPATPAHLCMPSHPCPSIPAHPLPSHTTPQICLL